MTRQQDVGVGLVLVATDTTAQLVEVAQAKAIGAINDDGVGIGDIDAALNDGGGQQHVDLAIDKAGHHLLQFIALHLAVTHQDPRLGQKGVELLLHRVNRAHAVVQKEHLTSTPQLTLDGALDDPLVVLRHDGLHRQPILWRRLDGTHVTRACERQIQCARNGRG